MCVSTQLVAPVDLVTLIGTNHLHILFPAAFSVVLRGCVLPCGVRPGGVLDVGWPSC